MLKKTNTIGYEHPSRSALESNSSALHSFLMVLYCLGILLFFDFVYSNLFYEVPRSARTADAQYHHGLAANFSGYDAWGNSYRLYTNSLGFKDGSARVVPLIEDAHRVLLMGDSFTEGVGLPFDDTFAGLLYRAGLNSSKQVEFLNAAVLSYSPVIYYKKIKYLLEKGLRFDEVVVFSDISDVKDEATQYFCIDEDPQYNVYCRLETAGSIVANGTRPRSLASNFTVSDRIRQTVKQAIHKWRHPTDLSNLLDSKRKGSWTIPGFELAFQPLGLEGGIARSLSNMQKLADLLARHGIPLTIVVYPWPNQLFYDDRESRQAAIWRKFCSKNCKEFINLFPAFFVDKDAQEDWYARLFIDGDIHFSSEGHRLMFRELAKHLL